MQYQCYIVQKIDDKFWNQKKPCNQKKTMSKIYVIMFILRCIIHFITNFAYLTYVLFRFYNNFGTIIFVRRCPILNTKKKVKVVETVPARNVFLGPIENEPIKNDGYLLKNTTFEEVNHEWATFCSNSNKS